MTFGNIFKTLRSESGKTLKHVSTGANVTVSYISDVEHGRRRVSKYRIARDMLESLGLDFVTVQKNVEYARHDFDSYNQKKWYEQ